MDEQGTTDVASSGACGELVCSAAFPSGVVCPDLYSGWSAVSVLAPASVSMSSLCLCAQVHMHIKHTCVFMFVPVCVGLR